MANRETRQGESDSSKKLPRGYQEQTDLDWLESLVSEKASVIPPENTSLVSTESAITVGPDGELGTLYEPNPELMEIQDETARLIEEQERLREISASEIEQLMQGKIGLLEQRKADLGNFMIVLSWRGRTGAVFTKPIPITFLNKYTEKKYILNKYLITPYLNPRVKRGSA